MEPQELHEALKRLHVALRHEQHSKWKRSVSFQDELFDRWERARSLGWGEGTSVYQNVLVLGDVKVGKNTWVGPGAVLDGSGGGLWIGDNCSISAGVHVYTHDTVRKRLTGRKLPPDTARVKIGNSVYIAPYTVVGMGVTIGDRVAIGQGSFVDKDIPSDTLAFGYPCRPRADVIIDGEDYRFEWYPDPADGLRKEVETLRGELERLKFRINELEGSK